MTHARDIAAVYAEEAAALAALEAALPDPAARQRLAEAISISQSRLVDHAAEVDPTLAPAARALQAWLRHHIATHSAALLDAKRAEVLALADQLRAALDREDLRPRPAE